MDKEQKQALARRVARDIAPGQYVNLGVGLPTTVADHIGADREVFLQSENGVIGRWIRAAEGQEDWDLVNAGKEPIQLLDGGAFLDHAASFAMMRGGHLDICVPGAFQVSERGDLANWHTGDPRAIPAVGGAMDLAVGAKQVFIMMEHRERDGAPKILPRCTYPLTGLACVSRIYTELAVIDVRPDGLHVVDLSEDVDRAQLIAATAAPLVFDL
ncbi:MAG: 3-oxoadipate CoA-transferase [Variovorax paradoxus]|nr:MAG: 3-oxoadipate CoA-transferase [Variovorax paradoxus]PZQ07222.1 MAG: 3-oxoadipate CoA-transferase [Variovorax paradoxus]